MKVVINIPDGCYEELTTANFPIQDAYRLVAWIKDGTPLPKGHGRLIDTDALVSKAHEEAQGMTNNNFGVEVEWLTNKMPAIIEADKEVEDGG